MALVPLTVVEVEPFPSKSAQIWSDDERLDFVTFIAVNPTAGEVIPGSGGVRKVRWKRRGSGKRGGVRVVYYFHDRSWPLFLLNVYAKSRKENLSPQELQVLRKIVGDLKSAYEKDQDKEKSKVRWRRDRRRS